MFLQTMCKLKVYNELDWFIFLTALQPWMTPGMNCVSQSLRTLSNGVRGGQYQSVSLTSYLHLTPKATITSRQNLKLAPGNSMPPPSISVLEIPWHWNMAGLWKAAWHQCTMAPRLPEKDERLWTNASPSPTDSSQIIPGGSSESSSQRSAGCLSAGPTQRHAAAHPSSRLWGLPAPVELSEITPQMIWNLSLAQVLPGRGQKLQLKDKLCALFP